MGIGNMGAFELKPTANAKDTPYIVIITKKNKIKIRPAMIISFLNTEGSRATKMSKPIWRFLDIPTLAPRKPIQIMAYFGICSDQGRGANKTYLQNTPQFTITAMNTKRIEAVVNVILSKMVLSFSIALLFISMKFSLVAYRKGFVQSAVLLSLRIRQFSKTRSNSSFFSL